VTQEDIQKSLKNQIYWSKVRKLFSLVILHSHLLLLMRVELLHLSICLLGIPASLGWEGHLEVVVDLLPPFNSIAC